MLGRIHLNSIDYDKNGNILSLSRQGHINEIANDFGVMDERTYSYDTGNKLLTVEDTADDTFGFKDDAINTPDNSPDYTYDDNGNMISDTNKNITSISYNHLNLPVEITFNDDPNQKINYFHTADGIKQQKVVTDNGATTTTNYTGSHTYENSSLKFINQAEGYIELDGVGGYDYVYQYKDHLGNIRLSYSDANNDETVKTSEIREEKTIILRPLFPSKCSDVIEHVAYFYTGRSIMDCSQHHFYGKAVKAIGLKICGLSLLVLYLLYTF